MYLSENKLVTSTPCRTFGTALYNRGLHFENYRYGFNGKEKDDEIKGEGESYNYGMRIYDSRLGRFMSVDPLTRAYPFYSPYSYAGNNPIMNIDLDGLENKQSTQPETRTQPVQNKPTTDIILAEASAKRADNIDKKVAEIEKAVSLPIDLKNINKKYINELIKQKLSFDKDGKPIVNTIITPEGKESKVLKDAKEMVKDKIIEKIEEKVVEYSLKVTEVVAEKSVTLANIAISSPNAGEVSSDRTPESIDQEKENKTLVNKIDNAVNAAIGKVVLGKKEFDPSSPIEAKVKTPANDATKVNNKKLPPSQ